MITITLGDKADKLIRELAAENEMSAKFFFTKIIIREARRELPMLEADRLKERIKLIDEVNDELTGARLSPPKGELSYSYSERPKSIYTRIWTAHKRLEARGFSEQEIHEYCLDRYGVDFKMKEVPARSPKKNPEWVGGGPVAQKIKEAQEVSRKIKVE